MNERTMAEVLNEELLKRLVQETAVILDQRHDGSYFLLVDGSIELTKEEFEYVEDMLPEEEE